MARSCELTGKKVQYGHNVSHSNRRTNRRFEPNLQKVSLQSEALGRSVPLRISTRALRSVQKRGGLDAYLLKEADAKLPAGALRLKHQVQKALSGGRAAKAS
ncbi:MAG: 50S ribosomal protein L28 [Proteobacteria bacterium]|nr:50S ribosomal protein L28 [Pseudomonadota bacterium]